MRSFRHLDWDLFQNSCLTLFYPPALNNPRSDLIDPTIAPHHGRVVKGTALNFFWIW
jgi:hypothetical protein